MTVGRKNDIVNEALTEEEQAHLEAVIHDKQYILQLENPSLNLQLAIVKENPALIRYFKNQTEELFVQAMGICAKLYPLIHNPTEAINRAAVQALPSIISHIDNPSVEVQSIALQKDPYVVSAIIDPSPIAQLKMMFNDQAPRAVELIKSPHPYLIEVTKEADKIVKNLMEEGLIDPIDEDRHKARMIYWERELKKITRARDVKTISYKHAAFSQENPATTSPFEGQDMRGLTEDQYQEIIKSIKAGLALVQEQLKPIIEDKIQILRNESVKTLTINHKADHFVGVKNKNKQRTKDNVVDFNIRL